MWDLSPIERSDWSHFTAMVQLWRMVRAVINIVTLQTEKKLLHVVTSVSWSLKHAIKQLFYKLVIEES